MKRKHARWLGPLAAFSLFGILFGQHHHDSASDTYDYGVTVPPQTPAPAVTVPTFPPGTSNLPVPEEAQRLLQQSTGAPVASSGGS